MIDLSLMTIGPRQTCRVPKPRTRRIAVLAENKQREPHGFTLQVKGIAPGHQSGPGPMVSGAVSIETAPDDELPL